MDWTERLLLRQGISMPQVLHTTLLAPCHARCRGKNFGRRDEDIEMGVREGGEMGGGGGGGGGSEGLTA